MERPISRYLAASAAVLVMAAMAGCASAPSAASSAAPDPVAQNLDANRTDDGTITRDVKETLADIVPTGDIAVTTNQGKVELTGQVTDAEDARRAVKNVLAVDGVRGVVNDLKVAPEGAVAAPSADADAESLSAATLK